MTIVWFIVWLVADLIGDAEPLRFDPVNIWAGTLIPRRGARPEPVGRHQPPLEVTG